MENSNIIAGLVGSLIFIFFLFFLNAGLFISGGAALAAFFGTSLIIKSAQNEKEYVVSGLNKQLYDSTMLKAENTLSQIKKVSREMDNSVLQHKTKELLHAIEKVIDNVRKEPTDFKAAQKFLGYYMEAALRVVTQYKTLGTASGSSLIKDLQEKAVKTIEQLTKAYEKELHILMEDNILNLDTEIQVLEKSLEMEGFSDKYGDIR